MLRDRRRTHIGTAISAIALALCLWSPAAATETCTQHSIVDTCEKAIPAVSMAGMFPIAGFVVRADLALRYETRTEAAASLAGHLGAGGEFFAIGSDILRDKLLTALDISIPLFGGLAAKARYDGSFSGRSMTTGGLAWLEYGF
jgi:hypothetical protein